MSGEKSQIASVKAASYGTCDGSDEKAPEFQPKVQKPRVPQNDCRHIIGIAIACTLGLAGGYAVGQYGKLSESTSALLAAAGVLLLGSSALLGPSLLRKAMSSCASLWRANEAQQDDPASPPASPSSSQA